jgi:hypothetical protein
MLNPNLVVIDQGYEEATSNNSAFYLEAAEKSSALTHLLAALYKADDLKTKTGLLKCIRRMSVSKKLCVLIMEEKSLNRLFTLLKENVNEDIIFFLIMEILWNILDDVTGIPASLVLGKSAPLQIIKELLLTLTNEKSRKVDKQKRNELMLLFYRIVEFNPESINLFYDLDIQRDVFELLISMEISFFNSFTPLVLYY